MCGEHTVGMRATPISSGSSPHVRGAPGLTLERLDSDRDHPRMCGEHPRNHETTPFHAGSSPHVRGALLVDDLAVDLHGIIPACAGSTNDIISHDPNTWDHPRMCGEHAETWIQSSLPQGSSPHVRGAPELDPCAVRVVGIIPACAGSTGIVTTEEEIAGDHPRMCGEHITGNADDAVKAGSSPHVRGALRPQGRDAAGPGIIPACAGSTARSRDRIRSRRDHPRMCGEHSVASWVSVGLPGSSPHVRGALEETADDACAGGIIPACAGSTLYVRSSTCPEEGSSPHVRGAHPSIIASIAVTGIIPACAGSTDCVTTFWPRHRDHPRMCGEHTIDGLPLGALTGSSPHVRGALPHAGARIR